MFWAATELLLLAGCQTLLEQGQSGAAIQLRDGNLVVFLCRSVTADEFELSERGPDADWVPVWTFSNAGFLDSGSLLSIDAEVTPPFVDEYRATPLLRPGHEIEIFINHEGLETISGIYRIGPDGLSSTGWLQTNGKETVEPCPSDE